MIANVECMMLLFGGVAVYEYMMIFIAVSPLILALIALIDILRYEFTGNNKLIWLLVVILVPVVGTILYVIIGQKNKITVRQ